MATRLIYPILPSKFEPLTPVLRNENNESRCCVYRWSSSKYASPTQPGSRSLRTYGTFESIQRSMAAQGDDPTALIPSKVGAHSEPVLPPSPVQLLPGAAMPHVNQICLLAAEWDIPDELRGKFYPQALPVASGWADGMYDFESAQARFDLADSSLIYDAEFNWINPDTQQVGILPRH
jgi:hypothetical protein